MYIHKLANAAASVISVTDTATNLYDLLDTAAGTSNDISGSINAVDLVVEDGDIRMLMDGNDPTTTEGLLLKRGGFYCLRGIPASKIKLIRTGGSNVAVGVQVGVSEKAESTNNNLQTP